MNGLRDHPPSLKLRTRQESWGDNSGLDQMIQYFLSYLMNSKNSLDVLIFAKSPHSWRNPLRQRQRGESYPVLYYFENKKASTGLLHIVVRSDVKLCRRAKFAMTGFSVITSEATRCASVSAARVI
jgi:hypothetical protein